MTSPRALPHRRTRLIGWSIVALVWVIAVAACELLARRFADFLLVDGRPVGVVRAHEEHGLASVETLGDVPIWRRAHADRPTPAADKRGFRIVVVGDSVLVPALLDDHDGFARLLEQELNGRLDGGPYEVVNLSEGGWNTRQEEQILLHEGLPLAPDLVLVGVSPNDIQEFAYRDGQLFEVHFLRDLDQRAARGGVGFLARHSYLYNLIWLRAKRLEYAAASENEPLEVRAVVEPLQRMTHHTTESGARLAVLCFPFLLAERFDPMTDRCPFPPLVEWASTHGVPLFDPIAAYAAHANADLRLDDVHLSRLGHRVLVGATFDWLVAQRLVPYRTVRPAGDGA